jgi:general secretion pathway protein C
LEKAASLATPAALALFGLTLAYWTWAWFAPSPAPRAPAAVQAAVGTSFAGALFRTVKEGSGAGAAASGALRLMGIMAVSGGAGDQRGRAVLRLDAKKTVTVLQGEDVEPGLRLAEVHVDHVILERNGARETLAWPEKGAK